MSTRLINAIRRIIFLNADISKYNNQNSFMKEPAEEKRLNHLRDNLLIVLTADHGNRGWDDIMLKVGEKNQLLLDEDEMLEIVKNTKKKNNNINHLYVTSSHLDE